jgi:hypothetical protein
MTSSFFAFFFKNTVKISKEMKGKTFLAPTKETMESRIFISTSTSHKILKKQNYAKCFNNERRYEGEIQKLNNILRLHGAKVLKDKNERENVFQALCIISSKLNKPEWSPLYTAKAIDAAYLHRTFFNHHLFPLLIF